MVSVSNILNQLKINLKLRPRNQEVIDLIGAVVSISNILKAPYGLNGDFFCINSKIRVRARKLIFTADNDQSALQFVSINRTIHSRLVTITECKLLRKHMFCEIAIFFITHTCTPHWIKIIASSENLKSIKSLNKGECRGVHIFRSFYNTTEITLMIRQVLHATRQHLLSTKDNFLSVF